MQRQLRNTSSLVAPALGCLITLAAWWASPSAPSSVHGIATVRDVGSRGMGSSVGAASASMELPEHVGSWRVETQRPLPEEDLAMLGAKHHWQRLYRCSRTGQGMLVTLIEGAPGPVAAHNPEVCYSRQSLIPLGERCRCRLIDDRADEFWLRSFESRHGEKHGMTVAYAWYDGERWTAPRFPRFQLVGLPTICRLQVTFRHPVGSRPAAERSLMQFVGQLAVRPATAFVSR